MPAPIKKGRGHGIKGELTHRQPCNEATDDNLKKRKLKNMYSFLMVAHLREGTMATDIAEGRDPRDLNNKEVLREKWQGKSIPSAKSKASRLITRYLETEITGEPVSWVPWSPTSNGEISITGKHGEFTEVDDGVIRSFTCGVTLYWKADD